MSELTRQDFLRTGAAAGGVLAAGGLARTQAQAADSVAQLYEAAKKEGTLTWWTAHYAQSAAEKVRDAFKKKYPGVDVQFIRQTAQVIYQRALQDLNAGTHELDVFASTDEAHYPALKAKGALATFVPPDIGKLAPNLRKIDPDNQYAVGALGLVCINYNPKKFSAPKKWTDLLDPKYKGQITIGHPGFSGYVGNWVLALNDKYGWEFFTKLAANNPKIGRSVNDTVTDIVGGERNVGAGPDNYSLERKAAGNAIDVSFPEDDSILIFSPVGIMKSAPHPNAARLFMNFYYSREYSDTMYNAFNLPLLPGLAGPYGERLDRIKTYRNKVDRLAKGVPEVVAKWRETFNV